ncbi:hypothetical protein AYI69_g10433 [Smittium culicis]|uniref:Uncharacterized protein n=1 Tax=Smittium culicis TaxID=133412 RepID=A0A1R1X5P8_9FUNG|nr:hypothetical protein AYI69_g10433 [Smittium culicis]
MVRAQQPLLLPALESDIPGYSKISSRTNHNDANYTYVEVSNLVPRSEGTVNTSSDHNPSNDCSPRSQSGKSLLSTLGPTIELNFKQLTAKICWLLAVTGLLIASGIHRIDDSLSRIEKIELHLVIVEPKEKWGGQAVEKPCLITSHTDSILCPVIAYKVYKEKVAFNPCPTTQKNNSEWTVNRLMRFIKDNKKPLSVVSITRYIHSICDLIRREPDTPIPKGREIGATLATNAGVSSEDIVSHAFWSNYTFFDTYYRLTRN